MKIGKGGNLSKVMMLTLAKILKKDCGALSETPAVQEIGKSTRGKFKSSDDVPMPKNERLCCVIRDARRSRNRKIGKGENLRKVMRPPCQNPKERLCCLIRDARHLRNRKIGKGEI